MSTTIKLTSQDNHTFQTYFCEAHEKTAKASLIILHEIFGLTPFIRSLCEYWAAQGYHTLAPSLYDRLGENIVFSYSDKDYGKALATKEKLLEKTNGDSELYLPLLDIDATKNYLQNRYHFPVMILGLSFGGTLGWLAAARLNGIAAISAYYGTHIHLLSEEQPRCPIILHCAEKDDLLPLDAIQSIAARNPFVEIHTYPATHGFRCSTMEKLADQQFCKEASLEADKKTDAFFNQVITHFEDLSTQSKR